MKTKPFIIWSNLWLPLLCALLPVLVACDMPIATSPISVLPSPTDTATSTATVTPTPTATLTPTPTPITVLITSLPDNEAPESMWPPIQRETSTILVSKSGSLTYEMLPVQISQFWDYSRRTGRLAFSTPHAHDDLWIYDFTTNSAKMWLPEYVESAVWSPAPTSETSPEHLAVAISDPDTCSCSNLCSGITILSAKGQTEKVIRNASPQFAWSQDGQWIAYFGGFCSEQGQGVYIAPISDGISYKVARLRRINSIYDQPMWAQEHEVIFYPEGGIIHAASTDGSSRFRLTTSDAQPVYIEAQYTMLWSAKRRQLILAGDGGMDTPPQVVVYELSEDLHTAHNSYIVGDNIRLLGWWDQDETLVLTKHSQIIVWSLEEKAPVSP